MTIRSIETVGRDERKIIYLLKHEYYRHPTELFRDVIRRGLVDIEKSLDIQIPEKDVKV
jgi:hypothetical protein